MYYEELKALDSLGDTMNIFTLVSAVSVLVSNDIHYMHFLSKGVDFDKCHLLAQEYYERLNEEVDYLTELAVEQGGEICNFTNALSLVPNYQPEQLDAYDYPTIIKCITNKLNIYLDYLVDLRNAVEDADIQSKLDDMIRYWRKEIDYKLARRL